MGKKFIALPYKIRKGNGNELIVKGAKEHNLKNIEVDFGVIDEEGTINGLLGLDVLLKLGVNINLNKLMLEIE